jgi:thioredoxin reductase (NADPH)
MFFFLLFFVCSLFSGEEIPSVIIGGGVGGGTAALYLARAGLRPVVIEGTNPGGALIQSEAVENWPGMMRVQGAQLMDQLREQAIANGALYLREEAIRVDFKKRPFTIVTRSMTTGETRTLHAQTCIVATGSTPNMLGVPGEKQYWGHGVTTCAICDGSQYKGKKVGVVGGGDSAVLEALYLSNLAEEVTLFVRKDRFKASDEKRKAALLARPNVRVLYQTTVEAVQGDGQVLSGVKTKDREIALDGLFLAIGSQPNTSLFKGQLELDPRGFIVLKKGQQTSVPGVYAIGDVADPVDQQAISAAGDAAKAAMAVQREISAMPIQKVEVVSSAHVEVQEIATRAQLDEALCSSSGPILIDFYASWCGPCRRLGPKFASASSSLSGKVLFLKVNVDRAPELAQFYEIKALPTVILFEKGSPVERKVGEPQILELIDKFLKNSILKS